MPDRQPTIAELLARVEALERQLGQQPAPELMALKRAAWFAAVPYRKAARWCRNGVVRCERRGGRYFASPDELSAHHRRMKLSDIS